MAAARRLIDDRGRRSRREAAAAVTICVDTSMVARTREEAQALQRMMRFGVKVLHRSGMDLSEAYQADNRSAGRASGKLGVMHSKLMLADQTLILGSTNVTWSSQANVEFGARIGLEAGEALEVRRRVEEVLEGAEPYEAGRSSSTTDLLVLDGELASD